MRIAAFVGAATLALFVASMPSGIGWWDTGEFQTVPYIAGILHPTGFPAYTMLGWLFSHAFVFGSVAWRMNLFSGLAAAAATALLVVTAQQLGASRWASAAAGLAFAANGAVWLHASRAGVETLVLAFGSGAVACGCAWSRNARPRALTGLAAGTGLALATHLVAIWFVPGIALFALAGWRKRRPAFRDVARAAAAFCGALALYAYLPLRSAAVTAAHLDPVERTLGLTGLAFWDTDHPASSAGFIRLVTGSDFQAGSSLGAVLNFGAYATYALRAGEIVLQCGGWPIAVLGLAGLVILMRRKPLLAAALIVTAFAVVPFSLGYGALVDAQKYYLLAMWCITLCATLASMPILRQAQDDMVQAQDDMVQARGDAREMGGTPCHPEPLEGWARHATSIAVAFVLAAVAAVEVANNRAFFANRGTSDGRPIISEVQQLVPDGAIMFAGWSYVTPLAYAAYVEHSLGTRIPVTNVPHDQIAAFARTHDVYYLPFPESETDLAGAKLVLIPGSSPPLYHVVAR